MHIRNLGAYFLSHTDKRFFFDMLTCLIPTEEILIKINGGCTDTELMELTRRFGRLYLDADVIKYAFDSIIDDKDEAEMVSAIKLLNTIFQDQDYNFQLNVKAYLQKT
jgi:hypothetical protein